MDLFNYAASQATAIWYTSPTARAVNDFYISIKDDLGTAIQVISFASSAYSLFSGAIMHEAAVMANPDMPLGIDSPTQDLAQDVSANLVSGVEWQTDTLEETADYIAMQGSKEQEYQKEQQDKITQDPEKLEAVKQEAAKLEAEWAARRQADEQDRLSRQQEADQKVADRLDEALRRDREFQQEQADKAALEKPAQEQQKQEQVEDPRLAAQAIDHKESLAKFDKDNAERLKSLEGNHVGDPALPSLREKFNSVAADARTKLVDQQAAERTQLQSQVFAERQNPIQPAQPPRPAPPPPVINDPGRSL